MSLTSGSYVNATYINKCVEWSQVIIRIVKKALIMVLIQQLLSEYMVVELLFHNKMK